MTKSHRGFRFPSDVNQLSYHKSSKHSKFPYVTWWNCNFRLLFCVFDPNVSVVHHLATEIGRRVLRSKVSLFLPTNSPISIADVGELWLFESRCGPVCLKIRGFTGPCFCIFRREDMWNCLKHIHQMSKMCAQGLCNFGIWHIDFDREKATYTIPPTLKCREKMRNSQKHWLRRRS